MTDTTDLTHVPLSQEARTQSEAALEVLVRSMINSGYEAAEKGLEKEHVANMTVASCQPHLATVAATIRGLGVLEVEAQAAEKSLAEQNVILDQIQDN